MVQSGTSTHQAAVHTTLLLLLFSAPAMATPPPQPAAQAERFEGFNRIYVDPSNFVPTLAAAADVAEIRLALLPDAMKAHAIRIIDIALALKPVEGVRDVRTAPDGTTLTLVVDKHLNLANLPVTVGDDAVPLSELTRLRSLGPTQTSGRPLPLPRGSDLEITNPATALAVVHIGEVPVAELLPLATGVLHDVPRGSYELSFVLPNGFVRHATVQAP